MHVPLLLGLTWCIIALSKSESNWIEFDGSLYKFNVDGYITWLQARQACEAENSTLVVIDTIEERRWLEDRNINNTYFWVGLKRNAEGGYNWIDGPELDLGIIKWGPRAAGMDECVESDFVSLHTRKCDEIISSPKVFYVCEKDVDFDPCQQYIPIEHDIGRTATARTTTASLRCDHLLIENWYRFESPSGNTMATYCVPEFHCSTIDPVWMNGTHPTYEEGVVKRTACAHDGNNCCRFNWNIGVKNCSDFVVYQLPPTPICYQAYCIGNEIPCPRGKTSENGWTPCQDAAPELLDDPVLTWRINEEALEVEYVCDITPPTLNSNIAYYVQWFIGEEQVHHEALNPGKNEAILGESFLIGKLGKKVSCMVKGKIGDGAYSPPRISNEHFAGIEVINSTDVHVDVGDPAKLIMIRPTLPVICPKNYPECILHIYAGITLESITPDLRCPDQTKINEIVIGSDSKKINRAFCGVEVTSATWNQIHVIPVKATIHPQYSGTKQGIFHIYTRPETRHKLWDNFHLEMNVQINGKNLTNNLCRSWNDPHMKTFDDWKYEHHLKGTFVLFKNKQTNFEVQAYYDKCINAKSKKPVMCNCAVAIKSSDMLLIIDRCDDSMTPVGIKLDKAPKVSSVSLTRTSSKKGTQVYKMDEGRKYQVILPTGTIILIEKNKKHINIALRASHLDFGQTEGLCGTFNGDIHDDFTDKKGNVACAPRRFCKKFARSWMVSSEKKGLFKKKLPNQKPGYEEFIYCKCSENPANDKTIECDFRNDVQTCRLPIGNSEDITDKLRLESVRRRRSTYHDFVEENEHDRYWKHDVMTRRKKRSLENYPKDKPGQWTTGKARQFCENFIAKTAAGRVCKKVPEVDFKDEINFCVLDIVNTGGTDWAATALEAMKEECQTSIFRNMSLWTKRGGLNDIPEPPENIMEVMCFNECSFQGTCVHGACVCNEGYLGSDCSVSADEPPEVFYIPQGGLCDIRERPCILTTVYGENFVNSPNLTCHLEYVKFDDDFHVSESANKIVYTKATFESYGEVRCVIPTTTVHERIGLIFTPVSRFNVYISNDGHLKSEPLLLTVYDSLCLRCSKEGSCQFKENTCLIDGRCHKKGDRSSHNACHFCDPTKASNEWSFNDENTCSIDGACLASGQRNPYKDCQVCKPTQNKNDWTEECVGLDSKTTTTEMETSHSLLTTLPQVEMDTSALDTSTISSTEISTSTEATESIDISESTEERLSTGATKYTETIESIEEKESTEAAEPTVKTESIDTRVSTESILTSESIEQNVPTANMPSELPIYTQSSSEIETYTTVPVVLQSQSTIKITSTHKAESSMPSVTSESTSSISATYETNTSELDQYTKEPYVSRPLETVTNNAEVLIPSSTDTLAPSVLNTIAEEINIGNKPYTETTESISVKPPTTKPSNEFSCPTPGGTYPNPKDCRSFYLCIGWKPRLFICPPKFIYNRITRKCDHVATAPPCQLGSS